MHLEREYPALMLTRLLAGQCGAEYFVSARKLMALSRGDGVVDAVIGGNAAVLGKVVKTCGIRRLERFEIGYRHTCRLRERRNILAPAGAADVDALVGTESGENTRCKMLVLRDLLMIAKLVRRIVGRADNVDIRGADDILDRHIRLGKTR